MGVQDRQWWRKHYLEQRRREARTGLHRLKVRGAARPIAEPWLPRRSMTRVAIVISLAAVAAGSHPG